MEIEASPSAPMVAKKLWNIVRIVMIMLRKGIAKTKAISELNLLLKRGKLAITNSLTLHHRHHFATTSSSSFISPREYEFSCSNSPAINHTRRNRRSSKQCKYDEVLTASALQRALEMLNNNNSGNYSPFVELPGFGKSPVGAKKLRITDSPFPITEEEGGCDGGRHQVDMAAEEFIKRFYRNLNSQHMQIDAMDSPCYYSYRIC